MWNKVCVCVCVWTYWILWPCRFYFYKGRAIFNLVTLSPSILIDLSTLWYYWPARVTWRAWRKHNTATLPVNWWKNRSCQSQMFQTFNYPVSLHKYYNCICMFNMANKYNMRLFLQNKMWHKQVLSQIPTIIIILTITYNKSILDYIL